MTLSGRAAWSIKRWCFFSRQLCLAIGPLKSAFDSPPSGVESSFKAGHIFGVKSTIVSSVQGVELSQKPATCNLYSMTRSVEAVPRLLRVPHNRATAIGPMPAIFPYTASIGQTIGRSIHYGTQKTVALALLQHSDDGIDTALRVVKEKYFGSMRIVCFAFCDNQTACNR